MPHRNRFSNAAVSRNRRTYLRRIRPYRRRYRRTAPPHRGFYMYRRSPQRRRTIGRPYRRTYTRRYV